VSELDVSWNVGVEGAVVATTGEVIAEVGILRLKLLKLPVIV
jgi:hypothetical protein